MCRGFFTSLLGPPDIVDADSRAARNYMFDLVRAHLARDMGAALEADISEHEVEAVLLHLPKNKSPGWDGLTNELFSTYANDLKQPITSLCPQVWVSGTFLASKTSHKDVADSKSRLFRAYYQHRLFMGYCCVGAEVLYLVLYIIAEEGSNNLLHVVQAAGKRWSFWVFLGLLALPGWAIKQLVNIVQIRSAAEVCVLYDVNRSKAD
ncbi:hypothetical protein L7F22_025581 [Adiantum nelumboides]|nr:hypothetical protein [Adiantum nelumboides]